MSFYQELNIVDSRPPDSLIPKCGSCGLLKRCQTPKMPVSGKGRRGILIVGEAPGKDEDEQGKPFVGRAGNFLRACLDEIGIDMRRDCWITNALICRPPGNKIDDPRKVDYCRPNLLKTWTDLKPSVVILLGTQAVRSLIGWLWKEDVRQISRWVGWRIPAQKAKAWVCPTWHPSYLIRNGIDSPDSDEPLAKLFMHHLRGAIRKAGKSVPAAPNLKVKTILNPHDASDAIIRMHERKNPIAFDYETDRLKPDAIDSRIITCAISDGQETIAYPWTGEAIIATGDLLTSDVPKIGWNCKFEDRWTRKEFGFGVNNWIHDGMLAAHVLDNRPDICSLKFQAFVTLGVDEYSDWTHPYMRSMGSNTPNKLKDAPLKSLLQYNGMDAALEYHVAQIQMRKINEHETVPN